MITQKIDLEVIKCLNAILEKYQSTLHEKNINDSYSDLLEIETVKKWLHSIKIEEALAIKQVDDINDDLIKHIKDIDNKEISTILLRNANSIKSIIAKQANK